VATSLTQPLSERYDYGTNQLVTQEETLPVTNIGEEQVHNVVSEQEKQSKIVHEKGKGYCVKSEKKNSDWSGGCYPTHGKAEERLKQVERAKHATDPLESIIFATNSFLVGPTPGGLKSLMHHIRRAEDALDLCSKEHISQEKDSGFSFEYELVTNEPDKATANVEGIYQGQPFKGVLILTRGEDGHWQGWDFQGTGPLAEVQEPIDEIQEMLDTVGEEAESALLPATSSGGGGEQTSQEETAVAPPGWEPTVKKMKKHKDIDNPYALSWYMKNKGDKPHAKK
jgi:hypothetical protein